MSTELLATTTLTAHEHIGFELGWDHAHHGVLPSAPYMQEPSALRDGVLAGQETFGQRTLPATRHVRKWLQLRLQAWLRGRSFETLQVTPHYLQQLDVSHCPITREPLSSATLQPSDASIDRVRNDAGYAAGNLAVLSTRANQAKGTSGHREALGIVRQVEADGRGVDGLGAAEWARIAVLCSFVEPLDHHEATALPLLVLPPNRLRLFNPAQALQAFVSRQLLASGWAKRASRLEVLMPGKPARRAFQAFFHALLPRVLEARTDDAQRARWALEDAWRNPLVLSRWTAFARLLTPAQCEVVLARASARKLGTVLVQTVPDAHATDGWQIESRGYVPHAVLMRRRPRMGRPVPARSSLGTVGQASLFH